MPWKSASAYPLAQTSVSRVPDPLYLGASPTLSSIHTEQLHRYKLSPSYMTYLQWQKSRLTTLKCSGAFHSRQRQETISQNRKDVNSGCRDNNRQTQAPFSDLGSLGG
ncbi:hypothetical protein DL546_005085 [Coniochaeta pulveracea]|uniref:Uncharacterized protein n=1 Tax=Coniochaeta pulveracea TaxID=177199 RepID=A0A420Y4Z7_9PEZI|nr:hypothetical protein DL546_005085 [Coniochaeta pulveracea]